MRRRYEGMFIFHPELDEEKLEKEIVAVEKTIKGNIGDGSVKYAIIGKKTLAYPVKKQDTGYYVNFQFEGPPQAIATLKEELRHRPNILRFIFFLDQSVKSR